MRKKGKLISYFSLVLDLIVTQSFEVIFKNRILMCARCQVHLLVFCVLINFHAGLINTDICGFPSGKQPLFERA